MNKSLWLIIATLLLSLKLLANNKEFVPGYIILLSGEKVEGSIQEDTWRINPSVILFKTLGNSSDTIKHSVQTILEFSTKDFKFERKEVKIDQSSKDINRLPFAPTPSFKEDTVFFTIID